MHEKLKIQIHEQINYYGKETKQIKVFIMCGV